MELITALYLLYALQCAAWVPGAGCLFTRTGSAWWISSGPGFRWLHPWPGARCWLALRFPLRTRGGRFEGQGGATWLSDRDGTPCELEALRGAASHAAVVHVGGRPFARAGDPAGAEQLVDLLRGLASEGPAQRVQRIEAELARSHSLRGVREARSRFEREARWLRWISDAYFVGLFALLPGLTWLTASGYALRLVVPGLLALHLATCVALAFTHARMRPGRRGERVQLLFGTALYPPGLLRAFQQLHTAALSSFAPAVVAAELLPRERAKAFLRREWLRVAQGCRAAPERNGFDLDALELEALRRLLHELGESPESLLAAPPRSDALARAYCPACLCEYRRDEGECSDCDIPLARHGLPSGSTAGESR